MSSQTIARKIVDELVDGKHLNPTSPTTVAYLTTLIAGIIEDGRK